MEWGDREGGREWQKLGKGSNCLIGMRAPPTVFGYPCLCPSVVCWTFARWEHSFGVSHAQSHAVIILAPTIILSWGGQTDSCDILRGCRRCRAQAERCRLPSSNASAQLAPVIEPTVPALGLANLLLLINSPSQTSSS